MAEEKPRRRKKRPPQPIDLPLEQERNRREQLTLHKLSEHVHLTPEDKFVILPGEKGHGWILRIYPDPNVEPTT